MDDLERLKSELADLHHGRGVRRPDLRRAIGPVLARVLELVEGSPDAPHSADEADRRILAGLTVAAQRLPRELKYVFVMASGMTADTPLLSDRMAQIGERLHRDTRTLRRRLREADAAVAEVLLADEAERLSDPPPFLPGWYVTGSDATLWLDRERPEFLGIRDIRVTADRLDLIEESISIPRPQGEGYADELEVVAEEGCTLEAFERVSPSTWRFELRLDRTLHLGSSHRLGLRVILPSRHYLRPYSVLVPFRACRRYSTTVHFGTPPTATQAWRVNAVAPAVLEDAIPGPELFDLSDNPIAHADFPRVYTGLAYGIGWSWADAG